MTTMYVFIHFSIMYLLIIRLLLLVFSFKLVYKITLCIRSNHFKHTQQSFYCFYSLLHYVPNQLAQKVPSTVKVLLIMLLTSALFFRQSSIILKNLL